MKTSFDASVPARKPKTHINRVLTELTARTETAKIEAVPDEAKPELVPDAPEASASVPANGTTALQQRWGNESAASQRDAIGLPEAPTGGTGDWERLAILRERLNAAAQPRSVGSEPQDTAVAVRKLIDDLRARLDAAVTERSEMAQTLEATRAALARTESELEQERKTRADLEAQADERAQVATQAVAEAESLAAERDLVLGQLADRRRLAHEQSTLLAEAEAALSKLSSQNEATALELAEAREMYELRAAEVADYESRLRTEVGERTRVEARCRELEARLSESASAMQDIRTMVSPQR